MYASAAGVLDRRFGVTLFLRRRLVMREYSERSSIYFEPEIHHALRVKAENMHESVSELVNDAVCLALREDAEDSSTFEERPASLCAPYQKCCA